LMKNEAKTLFFECFLGLKMTFFDLFNVEIVSEMT